MYPDASPEDMDAAEAAYMEAYNARRGYL